MVELKKVSFSFGTQQVLNDVDLTIRPGEIYGLFGQNGAGKTSLLKLVCGSLFSKTGSINVFGKNAAGRNCSNLNDIFLLPEDLAEYHGSGKKFTRYYAPLYSKFSFSDYHNYLKWFEINERDQLERLSLGAQKKFYLSFALACNCRLTMLDEPTNGLDITSKSILRKVLLAWINEDRAVVISSHQARELNNIVDRVLILKQHQLVFNESIVTIQGKYNFGLSNCDLKERALFSKRVPHGFAYIAAADHNSDSDVDVELLYEAVLCGKV